MLKSERRQKIVELLLETDRLTIGQAVKRFQSSVATIRRDFAVLAEDGAVERERGGIRRLGSWNDNVLPFSMREKWHSEEKNRLAKKAAELLSPGDTLFIDGGTTTRYLALHLPAEGHTVITNSLPLAVLLNKRFPSGGGPEIILTGGNLQLKSGLMLGSEAEEHASHYHVDVFLTSVRGVGTEGIFNNNASVAGMERVMLSRAHKVIVLADHSKIGKVSLCKIGSLSQIDFLITSRCEENRQSLRAIADAGVKVLELAVEEEQKKDRRPDF